MKEYKISIPVTVECVSSENVVAIASPALELFVWADSPELAVEAVTEAIDFVRNNRVELRTTMHTSHTHDRDGWS